MQKVVEVEDIDFSAWDNLTNTSSVANWFQTREAFGFFNGVPFLEAFAFGVNNNGRLKGIVVGYVQKDGEKLEQFFSRRAIILGGPLLSDDITEEEFADLMTALKTKLKEKVIYIETRNLNDYSRWRSIFERCGFKYEAHLNYHVNCHSKEMVWKNIKENRRRQIKKALAEGVKIEEAVSEEEVLSFYNLLSDLYRNKVKTPLFPREFFLEFYRKGCGKYLLVKDHGTVIGGIMCPILDNRTIYELFVCGNDTECKNRYPSVMATWAAMDYAVNNDISRFDFMGAGKPNVVYGVREFKSKFGGELVEFGRCICVCKPLLFAIGKLGVKIMKKI